jgi:hypothetical protein
MFVFSLHCFQEISVKILNLSARYKKVPRRLGRVHLFLGRLILCCILWLVLGKLQNQFKVSIRTTEKIADASPR